MRAMILPKIVSLDDTEEPLRLADLPRPIPRAREILIQVSACGVCHTELDEIEGRVMPPILPIVPGHQVVGRVVEKGKRVTRHKLGDRVGVGWIHSSTGEKDENLSERFCATGCHANGGYAEYMKVGEHYAYPLPEVFGDAEAAPLLCAGAIGYRALRLCNLSDGDSLGLMGFGGSAHIVIQLALYCYPNSQICVFARKPEIRAFAGDLGAHWTGDVGERPPMALKAIIDTTPAWRPVLKGLANLLPGGRLVVNAIRKEDADKAELLQLSYHRHLWMEREIKSVANITSYDIAAFLPMAAEIPVKSRVVIYPLEAANRAITDLKRARVRGAAVLIIR
ncbi:MAG: alcohol dehydrogenase catalytic domain-containing protein [Opitutae bacterium]|nr:alcohol dehydrogenase catalytic domain-containing protein [Opitutae bacterium]